MLRHEFFLQYRTACGRSGGSNRGWQYFMRKGGVNVIHWKVQRWFRWKLRGQQCDSKSYKLKYHYSSLMLECQRDVLKFYSWNITRLEAERSAIRTISDIKRCAFNVTIFVITDTAANGRRRQLGRLMQESKGKHLKMCVSQNWVGLHPFTIQITVFWIKTTCSLIHI
jgi:hypothetical protein